MTRPRKKTLSRVYAAFVWGVPKPVRGTMESAIGRSSVNRKKMSVVGKVTLAHASEITPQFSAMRSFVYDDEDEDEAAQKRSRGKNAVTHYEVEESYGLLAARVSCTLETGRTHQIRVHLAGMGHGVLGESALWPRQGPSAPSAASKS